MHVAQVGETGRTCLLLLQTKDLTERGNFDYATTTEGINVYTCKWKDNKPILLISNYHGCETTYVKRRQKDGSKLDVKCTTAVQHYNEDMGRVDKADSTP